MKKIYFLGIVISFFTFSSCNPDDIKADIPAFLTITDVSVKTTVQQGSNSDNITDVKVFIDDQSLGTFELPATIPIRKTGHINLKIRPVIAVNGLTFNKKDYPFYTTYQVDTTFSPEEKITLNPVVEYFPTAIFDNPWTGENFETGINFEYEGISDTMFSRITGTDAFEGASGLGFLSESQTIFEARTPDLVDVPRNGGAIYMEFDYKATKDVVVSIYVANQTLQQAVIFLKSRSDYKKIYIDFAPIFSNFPNADNYNIAIGIGAGVGETAALYLDNVKLVRY